MDVYINEALNYYSPLSLLCDLLADYRFYQQNVIDHSFLRNKSFWIVHL